MIIQGDCLDVMRTMEDNSIDFIVTDPPYGLNFMGKKWDNKVPNIDIWKEALRVCKSGAMLAAFGGSRTHHHLMVALEQAGWEIRDVIMWLYGSGFPKSLDVSKAIDKSKGLERIVIGEKLTGRANAPREQGRNHVDCAGGQMIINVTAPSSDLAKTFSGYGTALKPAYETIIICMKPCEGTFAQNAEKWGVAGININESRVGIECTKTCIKDLSQAHGNQFGKIGITYPKLGEKLNPPGRWPSNIILDEEGGALLDEQSGFSKSPLKIIQGQSCNQGKIYGKDQRNKRLVEGHNDSGGASRFFYCAKASSKERNAGCEELPLKKCGMMEDDNYAIKTGSGNLRNTQRQNTHPCVKPISLMKYILKLLAPPSDPVVLDLFCGSGSTLVAAKELGIRAIGIEMNEEYCEIAKKRVAHVRKIS